jgi:hypothetical protein
VLAGAARGAHRSAARDVALSKLGSGVRQKLLDYQQYAPIASAGGELGGDRGGVRCFGDESALGALPNAVGRLGERAGVAATEALGDGALGRGASVLARGATEGAVFGGTSAVGESALHDTPLTGEALIGGVAHGAAGGMIAAGLLHGAGSALGAARGAFRPGAAAYEGLAEREFGEAAPGIGDALGGKAPTPSLESSLAEGGPFRTPGERSGGAFDTAGDAYIRARGGAKSSELGEIWKNREVTLNDAADRVENHTRDFSKAITEQQEASRVTDQATFGEAKENHMAKLVSPSRFNEQASAVRTWMSEAQEAAATSSSDSLGGMGPTARKQFDEQMGRLTKALESGEGHELFTAADDAKRWFGKQAQFGRGPMGLSEWAREADRLYQGRGGLMGTLESDVWGKAGAAQKAVNAATSENIGFGSRFKGGFLAEHGSEAGRPINVADTAKVSGFLGRLTKAGNDLDAQGVKDFIRTRRAFLEATENSYDHGGGATKAIAKERASLDAMEKTFDKATKETALINQVKRMHGEEQANHIGGFLGLATDTLTKPVTTLQRLAQIESHTTQILEKIGAGGQKLAGGSGASSARAVGLAPPKGAGKGFFSLLMERAPVAGEITAVAGANSGQKAFDKRARALAALQSNPAALSARVGDALGPIADAAPKTTAAATATALAGLQFIASKMPPSYQDPYTIQPQFQPTSRASATEIAVHTRYVEALDDPTIIMKRAQNGTLTAEHVEAVKAVYPQLYGQMRSAIMTSLIDSKSKVPYGRRIQLGTLLDLPTDASLAPDFVQALQATYATHPEAATQEPPNPNLSSLDVASSFQSAAQAVSGGEDR